MGRNNHWNDDLWDRLTKRWCSDFGPESAAKIMESLVYEIGGERITIPSVQDLSRKHRNMRICMLYEKGSTYEELAVNFDMSEMNIRRIVHQYAHGGQGNGNGSEK